MIYSLRSHDLAWFFACFCTCGFVHVLACLAREFTTVRQEIGVAKAVCSLGILLCLEKPTLQQALSLSLSLYLSISPESLPPFPLSVKVHASLHARSCS